jgi:hypothetical protein
MCLQNRRRRRRRVRSKLVPFRESKEEVLLVEPLKFKTVRIKAETPLFFGTSSRKWVKV